MTPPPQMALRNRTDTLRDISTGLWTTFVDIGSRDHELSTDVDVVCVAQIHRGLALRRELTGVSASV